MMVVHNKNLWSCFPTIFQKHFAEPLSSYFVGHVSVLFLYVHSAPSGPSRTLYDLMDRDVLPLTITSGGIFCHAALMQGMKGRYRHSSSSCKGEAINHLFHKGYKIGIFKGSFINLLSRALALLNA